VLHKIIHVPISISLGIIVLSVIAGVLTSMWSSRAPTAGGEPAD
jgi:hypothetical protein